MQRENVQEITEQNCYMGGEFYCKYTSTLTKGIITLYSSDVNAVIKKL